VQHPTTPSTHTHSCCCTHPLHLPVLPVCLCTQSPAPQKPSRGSAENTLSGCTCATRILTEPRPCGRNPCRHTKGRCRQEPRIDHIPQRCPSRASAADRLSLAEIHADPQSVQNEANPVDRSHPAKAKQLSFCPWLITLFFISLPGVQKTQAAAGCFPTSVQNCPTEANRPDRPPPQPATPLCWSETNPAVTPTC
jgi:hypothetical protein